MTWITPDALIPAESAQILISGYTCFRRDTSLPEKGLHAFLCALSIARLALSITLLFSGDNCSVDVTDLCNAAFLLELLFSGVLATGMVPSELSKKPYTPEEPNPPQDPAPVV